MGESSQMSIVNLKVGFARPFSSSCPNSHHWLTFSKDNYKKKTLPMNVRISWFLKLDTIKRMAHKIKSIQPIIWYFISCLSWFSCFSFIDISCQYLSFLSNWGILRDYQVSPNLWYHLIRRYHNNFWALKNFRCWSNE